MTKLVTSILAVNQTWAQRIIVFILTWAFRLYARTWRIKHCNHPQISKSSPVLYAHWHGDEIVLIQAYSFSNMAVMASRSRDGEMQAKFLSNQGYLVVRGSSSRGGAGGLKGLVDAVANKKWNASLAVDGPRGPRHEAKEGILKLAQLTGLSIIPGAAAANRKWVFEKAWNKAFLPKPFANCVVVYDQPIQVPRRVSPEEFESIRKKLEVTLVALKRKAEEEVIKKS